MTTPKRICRLTKIINISLFAVAGLGLSSCTSQSEQDFAAMHGYKRSDYFGTNQNKNFVPAAAEKPEYYTSGPRDRFVRPGHY